MLPIIIVTYNNAQTITDCLVSVWHELGSQASIIVVDNRSMDATVNRVEEFRAAHPDSTIQLIRNDANIGFARAVNQGVAAAIAQRKFSTSLEHERSSSSSANREAPYFLLLNPDALLTPGCIATLVQELNADPQIGVIAPKLTGADGELRLSIGRYPTWRRVIAGAFKRRSRYGWIEYTAHEYEYPHTVSWAAATCWLVRAKTWEDLGGFDEQFFLYIEDVDFCHRALTTRWRIYFTPHASIIHHQQGSAAPIIIKANKWELNGLLYYLSKHYPTQPLRQAFVSWVLMTKWRLKKLLVRNR